MTNIMEAVEDSVRENDFIILRNCFERFNVTLKLEGMNFADSIKLRTAKALLNYAEEYFGLNKTKRFIESSSGNLGVALSMMAASRGYEFTCIVDPNTNATNIAIMKAMGANVVVVNAKDESGGYLGTRKKFIKERLLYDNSIIWLNQYECEANPDIHFSETAHQININCSDVRKIYVGAGTTGTAMGVSNYYKKYFPEIDVIAVDSVGSVTFGGNASPRYFPGLGASVPPVFFKKESFNRLISVKESQTVAVSRYIARKYGLLLGASTCTVLAGMYEDISATDEVLVAISPDLGSKYIDTMYNDEWCDEKFGNEWRNLHLSSNEQKTYQVEL